MPSTDQPRLTFLEAAALDERDQLDARAACAEQERDEARDDRDQQRTRAEKAERERDSLARRLGVRWQELEQARTERDQWEEAAGQLTKQLDEMRDARDVLRHRLDQTTAEIARLRQQTATVDIATRDRIAADALTWAANRIDPGPRNQRPEPLDQQHATTMAADRGTATNLRFWAEQVLRGSIEPRPAGSAPHTTTPPNGPLAGVEIRGFHVGRAFAGTEIERQCPCRKAACGLVDQDGVDPACEQHPTARCKTMRQIHRADQCPAVAPVPAARAREHDEPAEG